MLWPAETFTPRCWMQLEYAARFENFGSTLSVRIYPAADTMRLLYGQLALS